MIQFHSNNTTNLHHITSHSTLCCPTTQRSQITVTSSRWTIHVAASSSLLDKIDLGNWTFCIIKWHRLSRGRTPAAVTVLTLTLRRSSTSAISHVFIIGLLIVLCFFPCRPTVGNRVCPVAAVYGLYKIDWVDFTLYFYHLLVIIWFYSYVLIL